jgi:hypothetical protein
MDKKKVNIIDRLNLRQGKTILVRTDQVINVGDVVQGDDGVLYTVKSVIMPTRPIDQNIFGIVYEDVL